MTRHQHRLRFPLAPGRATLWNTAVFLLCAACLPALADAAATTPNPGLKYYYPAPDAPVVDVEADVIIYGGTSGGVVAAVQAVRMGKSVALVVYGRHVGGMTSGGLSYTDGVNSSVQGGITREYFNKTGDRNFKPSVAEQAFEDFLADPVPGETWDAPIPTYYEQRLASVDKDGNRIIAIHMENGSVFRGRMFIDCSYEGELLARAGVSHTWGREAKATYGESRAGVQNPTSLSGVDPFIEEGNPASGLIYNLIDEPLGATGSADEHLQGYNFRMYTVQSSNPATMQPLFEPSAYNPDDFELLYRYHRGGGKTGMQVGNDINDHEVFTPGCSTDHVGGNRWPDGQGGYLNWANADYATRELMFQSHVAWQVGMLWYIRTNARYRALATDPTLSTTVRANIQALMDKVDQLGLPLGEYPETGGWPHELYVREARRMVSDFVVTQQYYDRTLVVEDSIGQANYQADSHMVRRIPGTSGNVLVEGGTGGSPTTAWRVPYRSLIPPEDECANLLVSWAVSASHIAFCSIRMEPCHMVMSQSAATAAALCIDRGESVQDLPYAVLRRHLLADGQILGAEPVPEVGLILDNMDSSKVATTGTWILSSSTGGYYGVNYLHDNDSPVGGAAVTFTPELATTEDYGVYLRWTSHDNRADNVPVDIIHAGGTSTVTVNQKTNGGTWNLLGTFAFNAGTTGAVKVRNDGANGYVIADAVKFVATSTPPVPEPGVHVLAADPEAGEEGATPGRFQFVRDTETTSTVVTVDFLVSGSAVPGNHYTAIPDSVTIPIGKRSVSLEVIPVPDSIAQGDRSVIVTVQPGAGYTVGEQDSATVFIRDKPYDGWRYRHFAASGLENDPASLPDANPDLDDKVNKLEFVLGTDPLSGAGEGIPSLVFDALENVLNFEYTHTGEARQTGLAAMRSATLAPGDWEQLPDGPATVEWDPDSGDRRLRHELPVAGQERVFIRLELP